MRISRAAPPPAILVTSRRTGRWIIPKGNIKLKDASTDSTVLLMRCGSSTATSRSNILTVLVIICVRRQVDYPIY